LANEWYLRSYSKDKGARSAEEWFKGTITEIQVEEEEYKLKGQLQ
jgi:hypothetical protein